MQKTETGKQKTSITKLIKKFGIIGFLFFLIKGLLWLIVPAILIWFGISC